MIVYCKFQSFCLTVQNMVKSFYKEQLLKIGGGIGEEIAETWAVKEAFEKSYFV